MLAERMLRLVGDRGDGPPLRGVFVGVVAHHPDRPLPDFRGKPARGLGMTPILSRNGVSGNPGAVHGAIWHGIADIRGNRLYGPTAKLRLSTKEDRIGHSFGHYFLTKRKFMPVVGGQSQWYGSTFRNLAVWDCLIVHLEGVRNLR